MTRPTPSQRDKQSALLAAAERHVRNCVIDSHGDQKKMRRESFLAGARWMKRQEKE